MVAPSPQTISISEFKARCLAVLKRVQQTGQPIIVTRRGEPVAEVVPPRAGRAQRHWLGSFRESGAIIGDVVTPASDAAEWEALTDGEGR